MLSALHLIWNIPLAASIGFATAALLAANKKPGDDTSAVPPEGGRSEYE